MKNITLKSVLAIAIISTIAQTTLADDTAKSQEEITEDSGTVSFEITFDKNKSDENDSGFDIKVKKDGVELDKDATESEMEEWEENFLKTMDEFFSESPRKGIFAIQQDRDSGFLELGFGLKTSNTETKMREGFEGLQFAKELNAGIQLSGLFFEYFSASPNRALFGLNFFNSDWVGLDIIIGNEHRNFADKKADTLLLPINVRHADFTGGIRSTVYLGPVIVQGQVRREISSFHGGYTGSLQTGTSVQIKNLSLHAVVGASFQSEEVVDYYYGVTPTEVSANFAQYNPGSDTTQTAEVGASYPMGEDWVLRGQINYTNYSEDIVNSPFWNSDETEQITSKLMLMLVL